MRGIVCENAGDVNGAEASYRYAISMEQFNIEANVRLGVLYIVTSDADLGMSCIQVAASCCPSHPYVYRI